MTKNLNAGERADMLALELFTRCKHWQGKSITAQAMRSILRGALKGLRYQVTPLADPLSKNQNGTR